MKVVWLVLGLLVAGCVGLPDSVSERPNLESCAETEKVFLPPGQGVGVNAEDALMAIDCVTSAWTSGEAKELDFTLMGTEGEEYRAIIQVREGSLVDYFRESDNGWEIYLRCWGISFPEPGIPEPIKCDSITRP